MNVLVLGCGPAGLMAAHAAATAGAEVRIVSKKEKSFIGGAQYLHLPIPGVNEVEPEDFINVRKIGTQEDYALKIYGDPDRRTSWDDYEHGDVIGAWDLRRTYDILWNLHCDRIVDLKINPGWVKTALTAYDLVVSTIPAPALCQETGAHVFKKQKVLIDLKLLPENNVIIWNGDPKESWYRASRVFNVTGGYEYPLGSVLPGAHVARKPLFTNCDCFPAVLRAGRYGAWNKKLLTHDAYTSVMENLIGQTIDRASRI